MAQEKKKEKNWKDMTNEEKLAYIPARKKELEKTIQKMKEKISEAKKELAGLGDKEKAVKYDMMIGENGKEKK